MSRDEEREAAADDPGETPPDASGPSGTRALDPAAETRLVEDDEAPATSTETRVLEEQAAAETRLVENEASEAETRVIDPDAPPAGSAAPDAETRVIAEEGIGPSTPELDPSEDPLEDGDEDRTQVVTRVAGTSSSDAAPGSRPVPPLPSDGRASDGTAADGTAETRVLGEPDKTAPPPVRGAAPREEAAPTREAAATPPPAEPTEGDPERGLTPGTILFGEYEIVNVLGVGGMGEVYRAKHRRLEEHRAIKVMHAELSKKKGASEFFYREAKALLAVRHPAVVHCHDLLSDDAGRVYLIMEMIEGVPLSKKMNDGPLSPDDVAILGARVAHGLSAAHRKGVIHRDLSPDNIVLPNGRVREAKIIDFGIAKLLEEGEGTILDGFKGKLSYASPEQLGFFGGKIDGRSDFYSLGLVLAAAALGRPMGMGTTVMEAVDARRSFQTLPDEIPVGLRSAIQALLALDPDDRPRYVDRLFVVPGGIEDVTDSAGMAGTAAIGRSGGPKRAAGSRGPTIAAAAGLALALLGGGVYWAIGSGGAADRGLAVDDAARAGSATAATSTTAGTTAGTTDAAEAPTPPAKAPAEPVQEVVAKVEERPAARPEPRRPSASERIRIIGLLSNARLALEENRLMSPANDNAYDRYRRVLELDPSNAQARSGLTDVAARYVSLAERAIDKDELEQARSYVERARTADADHPGIPRVERRLVP